MQMIVSKKIYFYLPFFIIFITIYRNSLIPGGKSLIGNDIFLIFAACCLYLILLFDFNIVLNFNIKLIHGDNKYILILFALLFFSTLYYNVQELSDIKYLIRFLDFILYFIIFFLIVPKFIISNPVFFKKLVLILSYFSLFASIVGFIMLLVNFDSNFPGLMISFIGHPNWVPIIFNAGVISTIFYIDWQKKKMSPFVTYFYIFSTLIQLIASLLTYTRAGYIGLSAGLLVYFLFKYRNKFFYIAPIFILIVVFLIPPFFKAKGFGSFVSRLYLLIPAYHMMTRDNVALLWGYGATNTFKVFLEYNSINLAGEDFINNPHNVIASLILMFGVVFTIVIVVYLSLMMLRFSIRSFKSKSQKEKLFNGYILGFLISYIFLSFFDSSILMPEFFNLQIFFIFLGFIYYLTKPECSFNPIINSNLV